MAAIANWMAARMRSASPRFRKLVMQGPWGRLVAAAILRAMPSRLVSASASGLDLVVRWRVATDPERHLIVRDGHAAVRRAADRDPDLTLSLDRVTLLELATGSANGPQLFMAGRVRLEGDLMIAQRLASLFAVPG